MDHHRCGLIAIFLAATLCLVVVHEGKYGAAARPLRRLHAAEETTEALLDMAAEAPEGGVRLGGSGGEAVFGAGKWLPMPMPMSLTIPAAGGLRFPPVPLFPGAGAMPWLMPGGAPPAFGGGGMPALIPPYIGATRQEQLSLWASLFNPMQVRPRLPAAAASTLGGGAETTGGGGGEGPVVVVDRGSPAIASGGKAVEEGETMDVVPAAGAVQLGQPKWGVFLGNIDRRN